MTLTARAIVENVIDDFATELMDGDDVVVGCMAETNAHPFDLDSYEVSSADFTPAGDVTFRATLSLAGEQDGERAFYGDKITVEVEGRVSDRGGGKYYVEDHKVLSAEIDEGDDGDDGAT